MQLDWYDSHCDLEFLTKLKTKGNIITMFYPNKSTDILATCDGGLIKMLQDDFHRKVSIELEEHYDKMTGNDNISRKVQRDFIMRTYNKSIETIKTEMIRKIAMRVGATFRLQKSLEDQFSYVKLWGYTEAGAEEKVIGGTSRYKNVFAGHDERKSRETRRQWMLKESKRINSNSLPK